MAHRSARTPTAGASRCSWRRSTPSSASASPPSSCSRSSSTSASSPAFYALIRNRIDRLAALLIVARHRPRHPLHGVDQHRPDRVPLPVLLRARPAGRSTRCTATAGCPPWPPTLRALLPLTGLGVLLGFTTNIRTEGFLLLLALAARQLVVIVEHRRDLARVAWIGQLATLAVPWVAAVIVGAGMRLLLPTDSGRALKLAGGLGGHNFKTNDGFYRTDAGRAAGRQGPTCTGRCCSALLVFLIVLALGGMILGGRRDLPLSRVRARPRHGLPRPALPRGSLPARRGAVPPLLRDAGPAGHRTSAAGASSPATCSC